MNISLLLQMAADADPERIGLVCDGSRWSYQQLWCAAQHAAVLVRESGCEYVGLLDESSEAAPIALFGAALAGVPYVPLNYRLADADLAALLERISPALLIGDIERVARLSPGHSLQCLARDAFRATVSAASEPSTSIPETDQEVAAQIFTSGTTAAPKAALLKHANLMSYILGTVEFMSADPDDAALISVPPYHIAGISALMSSIYSMRRMLLLPAFDPDHWLQLATAEGATHAFVVPTMLQRIVERLDAGVDADLSRLRNVAYGGGRMPQELIESALNRLPDTGFTNAYGLTETSSTIALLGPEDHRQALASADPTVRARITSVGQPLPTIELEIRDDQGNCVAAGEVGEIYVRGEQVSGQYRERSALDADGWFPTRDTGWLDHDGYLFLGGRADDIIVRGGENISPSEIEDVLRSHPAIADAAALGIPSNEWGEAVAAVITIAPAQQAPSDEELKTLVRDRLRSSRVPEVIKTMDALPYNEMGKLLRRELKPLF